MANEELIKRYNRLKMECEQYAGLRPEAYHPCHYSLEKNPTIPQIAVQLAMLLDDVMLAALPQDKFTPVRDDKLITKLEEISSAVGNVEGLQVDVNHLLEQALEMAKHPPYLSVPQDKLEGDEKGWKAAFTEEARLSNQRFDEIKRLREALERISLYTKAPNYGVMANDMIVIDGICKQALTLTTNGQEGA
jgi:hypothetical protein